MALPTQTIPTTVTTVNTGGQPLVTARTWKIVIYTTIGFVLIMVALWIIRYAKNAFSGGGGGSKSGNGTDTNADGTPVLPNSVDQGYIDRIAALIWSINQAEDFSGYFGDRCEASNNIIGMRDEETRALSIIFQQKYGMRLSASIGRWESDGCYPLFVDGDIMKVKERVKNL